MSGTGNECPKAEQQCVATLSTRRRVVVDGGVFSRRGEWWGPRPDFQRRIEIDAARAREARFCAAQPAIRGETGTQHRSRDREGGEQREADEHDQYADAHNADGNRGGGEAILDCERVSSHGEARAGIEPANSGFADRCLTTWLPRRRTFNLGRGRGFLKPRWRLDTRTYRVVSIRLMHVPAALGVRRWLAQNQDRW